MAADETTFHLRYERTTDRFSIQRAQIAEVRLNEHPDEGILFLGNDPDEFVVFDNHEPGKIDYAAFSADNQAMKRLLGLSVLNKMYDTACEEARKIAEERGHDAYEWKGTFPASAKKRLACIGLHTLAIGASDDVIELWNILGIEKEREQP